MQLTRFYLRLTVLWLIICAALLIGIRHQPYDDYALRQLLLPDNCPMPCSMGVRPGVTTMDEAFTILKSNVWIEEIRQDSGTIQWTWSDLSPPIVDRNYRGYIQHSNVPDELCCVGSVKFNSRFALGDLYLLLGEPARTNLIRGPTAAYALVSISYVDQSIRLFTTMDCPLNKQRYWQSKLETYIESKALYNRESGLSAKLMC
ncbi:MAG: hypothetical protein GC179_12545 [Anaerolineaceae bacterium]|nr:hypothetical protein [Anaerolineaceae bacterium]